MGLFLFMDKCKQHPTKADLGDEAWGYHGPTAQMTALEREWIQSVINEKRVVKKPIEKPIKIPKGYLSYWESSAERDAKRLNRQYEFIYTRLKGLSQAIFGYSKRGKTPPKELLTAHKRYFEAIVEVSDQLRESAYNA